VGKAEACGLPMRKLGSLATAPEARVTALDGKINIGRVRTLSRRIHVADLAHHTVEKAELTRGIDGPAAQTYGVPTRTEYWPEKPQV